MMNTPDVAFAEFETEEQGNVHSAWIRAELTRRMQTPQGKTSHEPVLAEMDALIAHNIQADVLQTLLDSHSEQDGQSKDDVF